MNLIDLLQTKPKRHILFGNGSTIEWDEDSGESIRGNRSLNIDRHTEASISAELTPSQSLADALVPDNGIFIANSPITTGVLNLDSINTISTLRQAPVELTDETIDALINRLMERMNER